MIKNLQKKKKKSSDHLFSVFFNQQTFQWMLISNVYNIGCFILQKKNKKLYKITLSFLTISQARAA